MSRPDDPTEIPVEGPEDLAPPPGEAAQAEKAGGRSEPPEESAVATQIEDEIREEVEEIEKLFDRLRRLQAEFDNYRKREARERAAAWARAKGDLVQKLLGSIDDLDRVAHLDPETASAASVVEGVELVLKKLRDVLEREGLATIGEVGEPFDPTVHEAIGMIPAPSPEKAGRVAMVSTRGFRFGPQLLRPAQVQVYDTRSTDR